MPYQATVYRVFIASPSDVIKERIIAREVISEWNYANSVSRGLILHPIGWDTHSFPAMGDRPQAILNKQILENADLLIAIFRNRLGTPTGLSQSGTVEEINEHLKKEKPAMLYFSYFDINKDVIDRDQYFALEYYKNACKAQGLIRQFIDITDFKEKLSKDLSININTLYFDKRLIPAEKTDSVFPSYQRMREIYSYLWHWLRKLKEIIVEPPVDEKTFNNAFYEVNETFSNNIPFLNITVRDQTQKILSQAKFIYTQIHHPQKEHYIVKYYQADRREFLNILNSIEIAIRNIG